MAYRTNIYENCDQILYCLSLWSNDVTDGRFWTFMLMGFGIILMMATIRFGFTRAYGYASFAVGLFSVILTLIGFMTWTIASLFIINTAIALVAMVISER